MKSYIFSSIRQTYKIIVRNKNIYLVNIFNCKNTIIWVNVILTMPLFRFCFLIILCFFAKKNMKYFRGKTNASLNYDNTWEKAEETSFKHYISINKEFTTGIFKCFAIIIFSNYSSCHSFISFVRLLLNWIYFFKSRNIFMWYI